MQLKNQTIVRVVLILFVIAASFGFPHSAHAQGIITGDSVPAGETLNNDAILVGDQVNIAGTVNGNVLAIGNGVTMSGTVNGSILIIAQQALITGEVTDSAYVLSLVLELGDTAVIGQDLAYIGGSLTFYPGAVVNRDLTGLFFGATMGGDVGREVRAVIGPVEIVRLFVETFNIDIQLPEKMPWQTREIQPAGAAKLASLTSVSHLQDETPTGESPISTELLTRWGIGRLKEFVTLLVIGLVMVLLFPAYLEPWSKKVKSEPVLSIGYGLVIAIVGNVGALLLFLLAVALGLGILALGLSGLGFMLGSVSTLTVGLAYSVFLFFLMFVSKIVVAYMVGALILKRFERPSRWYKILPFLLGLLIYVLLSSIPFLGWVVVVFVSLAGTGAIWLAFFQPKRVARRKKVEKAPPVEVGAETKTDVVEI